MLARNSHYREKRDALSLFLFYVSYTHTHTHTHSQPIGSRSLLRELHYNATTTNNITRSKESVLGIRWSFLSCELIQRNAQVSNRDLYSVRWNTSICGTGGGIDVTGTYGGNPRAMILAWLELHIQISLCFCATTAPRFKRLTGLPNEHAYAHTMVIARIERARGYSGKALLSGICIQHG